MCGGEEGLLRLEKLAHRRGWLDIEIGLPTTQRARAGVYRHSYALCDSCILVAS